MRSFLEKYSEETGLELAFLNGHDNAIIGLVEKFNKISVLYNKSKVIENLQKDMEYEDALEYFDFNIGGAWIGDNTPCFAIDLEF